MDRSQLMRIATQAGFTSSERSNPFLMESLKHFAAAIKSATREECADLCDEMVLYTGLDCAQAIRNIGKEG